MPAQLGFSFRWVYQMPDQGVTFDSFGRPHSAVFVFNSGNEVARNVKFRGACLLYVPNISFRAALDALPWTVPKACHSATPPLWYPFEGTEMVGAGTVYGVGEVEWIGGKEQFCVVWMGGAWQTVEGP